MQQQSHWNGSEYPHSRNKQNEIIKELINEVQDKLTLIEYAPIMIGGNYRAAFPYHLAQETSKFIAEARAGILKLFNCHFVPSLKKEGGANEFEQYQAHFNSVLTKLVRIKVSSPLY